MQKLGLDCHRTQDFCIGTLDRADRALLDAVQKNSRLTSEELAQLVNLSPTACQRRLKRLREEEVMIGYYGTGDADFVL
jgi:Lrp/AsnC family transcriptional regulator, leucine-responsive regulatory protein